MKPSALSAVATRFRHGIDYFKKDPRRALFWLLFATYVLVSFQGIAGYFVYGHEGFGGAQRSIIARNYLWYGMIETGGKPVIDPGWVPEPAKRRIHWHHPPGANQLVFVSFRVFGESEAAARLVPVLTGIACFLLLYRIAHDRYGPTEALVAGVFFTFLPIRFCYGNMVNYEVPVTCAVLLALWLLERLRRRAQAPGRFILLGPAIALLAAAFIDWPGFIFAAVLGFDALLRPPRKPLLFLIIGVTSALMLVLMYYWLSSGEPEGRLMSLAKYRTGANTPSVGTDSFGERMLTYLEMDFGLLPLAASVFGLAIEAVRRRLDPVVAVFALGTAVYFAFFQQAAMKHDFYLAYLAPAVAMAAGLGVVRLARFFRGRWKYGAAALLTVAFVALEAPTLKAATDRIDGGLRTRRAPKIPRRSTLDYAIVGNFIRNSSDRGDRVLLHYSVPESVQLSYYMARNSRRAYAPTSRQGRLFVARARSLPMDMQRRLGNAHPVSVVMGYLIYDLGKQGAQVTAYTVKDRAPSLFWRYVVSNYYPPHDVVRDPVAAERYKRRLKVEKR